MMMVSRRRFGVVAEVSEGVSLNYFYHLTTNYQTQRQDG